MIEKRFLKLNNSQQILVLTIFLLAIKEVNSLALKTRSPHTPSRLVGWSDFKSNKSSCTDIIHERIDSHSQSNNLQSLKTAVPVSQTQTIAIMEGNKKTSMKDDQHRKKITTNQLILQTAVPAMMNLAIAPLVSSVETMWIGRMGDALALAGQSAASTAFLTCFYFLSFLPTIAAPMVASSFGAGKHDETRKKISETLSMCNILGLLGMLLMTLQPRFVLRMVLAADAPAMTVAIPYLRLRALSMIPALVTATGFAAFRGTLDTKTPLKISAGASVIKLLLDPLFIFKSPFLAAGATLATFCSEVFASIMNVVTLSKRNLIEFKLVSKPPARDVLVPLLTGGGVMAIRQIAINLCTIASSRYALGIGKDGGISAAAYGIVMQIYTIGFVVHVAMQGAAAAIIPSELAKSGDRKAQNVADRLFGWSMLTGLTLGLLQYFAVPHLIPLFTTLPAVQEAVRKPAVISAILHVVNGPRFVGEGQMIGLKSFRELTAITCVGMCILLGFLKSSLGQSLEGVMISNLIFCSYQTVALLIHYFMFGKLSRKRIQQHTNDAKSQ
mmetsp:Transcript_25126/g.28957  ORF Transcript_25126/g.28957 Transcript_25126/m.28957 type:complete len:556 (-) Transcript_25126:48-1715(-)